MMSETSAAIYIFQDNSLVDMDFNATGDEFNDAYRYDMESGSVLYIGESGEVRLILSGGSDFSDENPEVETIESEHNQTNLFKINGDVMVLITERQ